MPRGTPTPMPALAPVLRDELPRVDDEGDEEEEGFGEMGFAVVADARVLVGVAAAMAVMMTG